MKRILIVLVLALFGMVSYAERYRVDVKSTLNMRVQPEVDGEIVCKIPNGETVIVLEGIECDNPWAHVSYNDESGWVAARFLVPITEEEVAEQPAVRRPWYYLLTWEGEGYRWMAYVLMGMALLMWAELKFVRKMDVDFSIKRGDVNTYRWINAAGVCVFAAVSIAYVYLMGNNAMWFIMDVDQWYFVVVNFIFLLYVFVDMLAFAIRSVEDISESAGVKVGTGLIWGLLALMTSAILYVFCHLFNMAPQYVYLFAGVTQVAATLYIIIKIALKGNFLLGLFAAVIYAVGSVAVVVLLLPIVVILFVVFAACLAFVLAKVMATAPGGIFSDKDGAPNSVGHKVADSTEDLEEYEITNPEGQRTRLRQSATGSDRYNGSDGHEYHKIGNHFERCD